MSSAYHNTDYNRFVSKGIGAMLVELGFDTRFIRKYHENKGHRFMHNCEVCGKADNEKPMAFRTMPWCSENHRKQVQGDVKVEWH